MAIANGTCVSFCNQPKAHFGLSWVRPWDNRGKFYMDGKKIQCLSNASQHVFNRLRAIARYWSEIATFSYPLAFNAHWNFRKKFGPQKARIMGLPGMKTVGNRFSRFDTIPACDGQTDRMDRRPLVQRISITCAV